MPEPTNSVPVLYGDLVMIADALSNAHGAQCAVDLQRQYRELRRVPEYSPLSRQIEKASEMVLGYIVGQTEE